MTHSDYLKIILYGYIDNKKHLDGYFYRESKNAEIKHITPIEFFERLIDEVIKFEVEIKHNHFAQLNRHYLLEDLWEKEGKDAKLLENQKPILEDYSLNLFLFTNGQFRGELSHDDVALIKQSISKAMDKIKEEIKQTIRPENQKEAKITNKQLPERTDKKPKLKKLLTYNWIGKQQNKTGLFNSMKGIFISKETKVKDFCNIFENLDTLEIKPVKWLRPVTDLLLFLNEMMEAGLIKDERKRMSYKTLTACFCKKDGSQFQEQLKTIFQQIKETTTNEKIDIKELVRQFK